MRLIQLIANEDRHATGMTTAFAEMARLAQARGWSFEIAMPKGAEDGVAPTQLAEVGAKVHVLDGWGRRELAEQIGALLDAEPGPSIVHTHLSRYDVPATLAARSRPDVTLIWHVHSVLPPGLRRQLKARLKFETLGRRVDRIVIPFENTKDDLVKRGAKRDLLYVFHGCVDPAEFPLRTDSERHALRADLRVPEGSKLLLHFGWHWEEKGGDRFLETVKILRDSGMDVTALVNRGGEPAAEARDRLGLGDAVIIGGLVEDSRTLHGAADCMVAPSRAEGLTFAYIEALATGCPLVATNLQGEHYLYDEVEACIVSSHDPTELAAATREILDRDPAESQAAAEQAHEWVRRTRSVERVVADMMDEYERASAKRAPRRPSSRETADAH